MKFDNNKHLKNIPLCTHVLSVCKCAFIGSFSLNLDQYLFCSPEFKPLQNKKKLFSYLLNKKINCFCKTPFKEVTMNFRISFCFQNSFTHFTKLFIKRLFFQTNMFCVHLNPIFFKCKNEIPNWSILDADLKYSEILILTNS